MVPVRQPGVARPPRAAPYLPERLALTDLRGGRAAAAAAATCGDRDADGLRRGARPRRVVLVGEQPGDQEDPQGRPFVGPAGRCSTARSTRPASTATRVYVTNAVKHFKWEARGKRRIHQKPNLARSARAGRGSTPSSRASSRAVVVCLGATAAQACSAKFRVTTARRGGQSPFAEWIVATIHPSAILRSRDEESRHAEREAFVADLRVVAGLL